MNNRKGKLRGSEDSDTANAARGLGEIDDVVEKDGRNWGTDNRDSVNRYQLPGGMSQGEAKRGAMGKKA